MLKRRLFYKKKIGVWENILNLQRALMSTSIPIYNILVYFWATTPTPYNYCCLYDINMERVG